MQCPPSCAFLCSSDLYFFHAGLCRTAWPPGAPGTSWTSCEYEGKEPHCRRHPRAGGCLLHHAWGLTQLCSCRVCRASQEVKVAQGTRWVWG